MRRRKTRQIKIGGVPVGGGAPVSVQAMAKTDTREVEATVAQIAALAEAGAEIIRLAVPDTAAAAALKKIRPRSPVPLIADIHFDHRLALAALAAGMDGLRINPGNIGSGWKVREVVKACRERKVPIRVGANAGSIRPEVLSRCRGSIPRALVASALGEVRLIEKEGYGEIKISVKAFEVIATVQACRSLSREVDYPLHLGVTEAGPFLPGAIRSAVGIGALLLEGIGDTLRVSLTAPPPEEVKVAREILQALGLRFFHPVLITCPTCGRTRGDLFTILRQVQGGLDSWPNLSSLAGVKVAVMGCEVNGPGEARQADVGIALGKDAAVLFKKGEIVRRLPADAAAAALLKELNEMAG